jgi:hypothetical protein
MQTFIINTKIYYNNHFIIASWAYLQQFEVVDWESQYHAILGRPAFAKFMAVPHYAYLKLKMSGNNGTTITIHGSFSRSDSCDRDFQKIASKFGAREELNAVDAITDHTKPPADNRNVRSD